jgi:hypothetical protein
MSEQQVLVGLHGSFVLDHAVLWDTGTLQCRSQHADATDACSFVPYIATTESTLGIALSPAFNLVVVNMCYAANCCEEKQRGAVCVVSSQPQSLRNNYFSFSADSNEPLIKCSTRKGYALSNPIH